MVKLSEVLVLTVCSFGLTSASVSREALPPKPEEFKNVEGCYVKQLNSMLKFGEIISAPIGSCHRIECSRHLIEYASCGSVDTSDPNCYITEIDPSRLYPDCCPTIKCDSNNLL